MMSKFNDQEALQKAYESLEKEFTRRSQRLRELQGKIEQGTLIELPCIIVGNGAIDAFGKVRVPYYQVLWLDEFGFMKAWKSTDKAKAEKRLKELE